MVRKLFEFSTFVLELDMASEPMRKKAGYDDVKALPPEVIGEVLSGTLYTQPRPNSFHAFVATGLTADLVGAFQRGRGGPGGWIILHEPELHLNDDIVVPDLAGWRQERLAQIPDAAFLTLAPDWVCEVLSPGTASRDRTLKLRLYAREQVRHYWLVDPRARTLEILRLDGPGYRVVDVFANDETVRAEPFDAIELKLDLLWPPIDPS